MTKKEIWQYLREVNPTFDEMNISTFSAQRFDLLYRTNILDVQVWYEEMEELYGE